MTSMTTYQDLLWHLLKQKRELDPAVGPIYCNAADFVLRHGVWFAPRNYPPDLKSGPIKLCFGTSIMQAARYGWRYIEGFALMPGLAPGEGPAVMLHAWNADIFNALIDSTWDNDGLAYLGVEFSVERADEATWYGNGSVLQDAERGYPLFQHTWTGEDFSLKFQTTESLALLRAGKPEEALAWLRRNQ
jgi:hypothetical protein